jgi:CubicO group peptidase (beta-lactamase class C family)
MGHLAVKTLLADAIAKQIGSGLAASYGNLHSANPFDESRDIFAGLTSHPSSVLLPNHEINSETYFDLASLTKILATTTLAMKRVDQGLLDLTGTLADLLPRATRVNPTLVALTVQSLLTHTSGLPAWKPYFEEMRKSFGPSLPWKNMADRKEAFDELLYLTPLENPLGAKIVYSDLGFLMLENLLSSHFKRDVESMWRALGISGLHFRPVVTDTKTARFFAETNGEQIAATEICPWRGMLVGQVHDDNTWSRGGIAGHAGAFGRLSDVKGWIRSVFLGNQISRSTLKKFTNESASISGTRRALGFDMPSGDGSGSTGFSFSQSTVGHLGFTGTSLWIDMQSGDYAILLTNRVHPSRDDLRIRPLRREFHRLVREK